MRRGTVLLMCVALLAALGQPALEADDGLPIAMSEFEECVGVVPHVPTNPTRTTITANIVVALDGVTVADAKKVVAKASSGYAPGLVPQLTPDIKIKVVAYHDLTSKLKGNEVTGFVVEENPIGKDLMSQMIRYYRAKYPKLKRHHVHLLTSKDISGAPYGKAVAGIANCIGGIGTPYGYAITEITKAKPIDIGPLAAVSNVDAKNMAHEMGHVFGAHHHYSNCVEDLPTGLAAQTTDVCSTMWPELSLLSLHFSAAEVLAIRGYAEAHIAKTNPLR